MSSRRFSVPFSAHPSSHDDRYASPQRARHTLRLCISTFLLSLLLFTSILSGWGFAKAYAFTGPPHAKATPGSLTFQKFLQLSQQPASKRAPFVRPQKTPPMPVETHAKPADYKHLPPSAEPATMKPVSLALTSSFLTNGAGAKPFDVTGSDSRLEIQIPPGSLDVTHATTAKGTAPVGNLTLVISQIHGHYTAGYTTLGSYQLHILDSQGQTLSGITLHAPVTFIYHYQPWELQALGLDPGRLFLVWPPDSTTAKPPAKDLLLPLSNDAKKHTLTAQSTELRVQPFDAGAGDPQNQGPPIPRVATVQGNAGQFTYAYPIQVAPGANGFAPQLSLTYSSSVTNQRHSFVSPSNDVGEGWGLNLGSISAEEYPASSAGGAQTWYFISGVDNVSDRLIQDTTKTNGTFYLTEHISHLRIQFYNNCFTVWDPSGTSYEFGCTPDSKQYWTDANNVQHVYRYDLDKMISANNGSSSSGKAIFYYYVQDKNGTTIRDAAIKQILYGTMQLSNPNALAQVVGTVDFYYKAPSIPQGLDSWVQAYGTNYNCASAPPKPTTLRCDDPIDYLNGLPAPKVMSTLTLLGLTSYVGDTTTGNVSYKAYHYDFTYQDLPFTATGFWGQQCFDPTKSSSPSVYEYCAGEHLLTKIVPTVYQAGTAHALKPTLLNYTQLINSYSDQTNPIQPANAPYVIKVIWQFLSDYLDTNSGAGGHIVYQTAYSNSHGTPIVLGSGGGYIADDRTDPLYCFKYADCTGAYAHPDDRAWTSQVVTSMTSIGVDSGSLTAATTTYDYRLRTLPNATCPTATNGSFTETFCVTDTWIPQKPGAPTDTDWQDFYHGEYRGFNFVYQHSPANDLTVDAYYTTDGWNTPEGNGQNYNGGQLYREDVYNGPNVDSTRWLRTTFNAYPGFNSTPDSCNGLVALTYVPCIVFPVKTRTTFCEQNASDCDNLDTTHVPYTTTTHAPWVEHDYTYDDYLIGNTQGYNSGPSYHNLTQEVITSSNAPTVTKNWAYTVNDTGTFGTSWVYYDVNKVAKSDISDAGGHNWQCQSFAYDEMPSAPPPGAPGAGLLTTTNAYTNSNCPWPTVNTPSITSYTGYDAVGNAIVKVDGVATANSALYGSTGTSGKNGCTVSPDPVNFTQQWGKTNYTTCTGYDTYLAQPTSQTNAFTQQQTTTYDYSQGALPTSTSDLNSRVTTKTYSYDSNSATNNKLTVGISQPDETPGVSTSQSSSYSTCTTSPPTSSTTILPCFEIDSTTAQYPNAIAQTFYDGAGRVVETSTPTPTPSGHTGSYYTIVLTEYSDSTHSVWKSTPFVVSGPASGAGWLDPHGAKDYTGSSVFGTATYYDALNRPIAVQDPLFNPPAVPGISCASLGSAATSCLTYAFGQAVSDTANYYVTTTNIDPNNHVASSFGDALGRTRYTQEYSGVNSGTLTPNKQVTTQYNVLDKPTSVVVTDLAPQANQSVTSVTTTATYDDFGRLTQLVDPDRGTYNYTYDANDQMLSSSSGTHILGSNYDLLGRLGCQQDTALPAASASATGACSGSGERILRQNTYDVTAPGVTWSGSDYPIGRLTQSVTTTYFPDSTSATTTQSAQFDTRGRTITQQLQLGVPTGWNVSTALPTYQVALTYNDANQVWTTTTSTLNPTGTGYTFSQVYDPTTGVPVGLSSTTSTTVANLASLSYTPNALVGSIMFQTSSGAGSNLASEQFSYDGDLRPTNATASWQSGSGATGQIFSQGRWYDPASNVLSLSTTQGAVPGQTGSGGSETQNFCYDEQNRLVWSGNSGTQPGAGNGTCGSQTIGSGLTGASYTNSFVYTHLGQLWQGPLNGSSTSYQYFYCGSAPHQLSGLYSSGTTCANKASPVYQSSYNAWGDVTGRTYPNATSVTLAYNSLDQFVRWTTGTGSNEFYAYDSAGNRVLRRSTSGGTTTMTVYAFGLEEHLYSGTGTSQGNTYYYSLAGRLIGELTGTTLKTNIFLTDPLGSVLATFNNTAGTAALLGNQVYGPYGTQRYSSGGTMGTNKGFTGQYNDSLTGLDYYNARYYDPVVGVFLAADTVQGNPQGMNPYAYVGGNPETKNDPTGQRPVGSCDPNSGVDCPPPPGGSGGGNNGGGSNCGSGTHWDGSKCIPNTTGGGNKPSSGPTRAKSFADCTGNISCGGIKDRGMFVNGLFDAAAGLGLMAALFALMSNPAIAGLKALTSSLWRSLLNQIGSWMLSGLHMILSSLDRPNPFLLVIVDVVKLAADVATALYSLTDIWELIQQGPGKTLLTKVDTFASDVLSFLKGGTGLLTIGMRALQSVGDVFLTFLGVDTLKSDWSTLQTDIGGMQQMYNQRR